MPSSPPKSKPRSDGRWLAFDARALKMDQRTLSALYHTTLRSELTTPPRRHLADTRQRHRRNGRHHQTPSRDAFSARTTAIADRLQTKLDRFETSLGRQPTPRERWKLEREAVLDCRPTKTSHHPTREPEHGRGPERGRGFTRDPSTRRYRGR